MFPRLPQLMRTGATLALIAGLASAQARIGEQAPGFTLPDTDGNVHGLADFAGKTVVLEWFNPDCPFCRAVYEGGVVARTIAALGDDVVYLAVNSTAKGGEGIASPQSVIDRSKGFLKQVGVDVTVLMDHAGTVGRAYGAKTTPHCFVIDGKGVLRYEGAYTDDPSAKDPDATNYVLGAVQSIAAGKDVAPTSVKSWGCGVKYAPASQSAEIGAHAPEFVLTDTKGATHRLSDYRGRTVVLEWFNPGCPYCRMVYQAGVVEDTLTGLQALADDTVYLAINSTANGVTAEQVAKQSDEFLAKTGVSVPVLIDHSGTAGRSYGAKTTPHCYVIDAHGILRYAGAYTDDTSGKNESATNYVLGAVKQITTGGDVSPTKVKPWGCSVKYARGSN